MTTATKYAPARITKAVTNGSGQFSAILAAFGPPADHQGEYFEGVGTFTDSILTWQRRGQRVPIFWNHQYESPNSKIGELVSMHEIASGLLVEGQLNLKNPRAVEVYESLLTGALSTLSIGFSYQGKRQADDGVVITKADILEATFTAIPAEPRAVVLDVKNRDNNRAAITRDDRLREAGRVPNLVAGAVGKNFSEARGAVERAVYGVVDDDGAGLDDIRAAATRAVERAVEHARYAQEDGEIARKWGSYAAKQALDGLEASLYVTKGQGRHESVSFDETNAILVREHLRQRHPNVNAVQLDASNIGELNTLHKLAHGGGVPKSGKRHNEAVFKALDALETASTKTLPSPEGQGPYSAKLIAAEVRATKQREEAEKAAFTAANDAIQLSGRAPGFAPQIEAERENERLQRDLDRIAARDAEKAAERASAEESARISREDRRWHGDSYWTDTPTQALDERRVERAEPRVVDATIDSIGTSTGPIPVGMVDQEDSRLLAEAAPKREAWTIYNGVQAEGDVPDESLEPDSFQLPTGAVNTGDRKIEKEMT